MISRREDISNGTAVEDAADVTEDIVLGLKIGGLVASEKGSDDDNLDRPDEVVGFLGKKLRRRSTFGPSCGEPR